MLLEMLMAGQFIVHPEPQKLINIKPVTNDSSFIELVEMPDFEKIHTVSKINTKPVQNARNSSNKANTYARGYCTWHVKNLKPSVPNGWGNAINWLAGARSAGWTVSSEPVVGAIAYEHIGGLGHVAYVTNITSTTVTVSEMNYKGWNIKSSRTVPISKFTYIY